MVTGNTGFLGSWITFWLRELGADVIGFARRPASPASLFGLAGLDQRVTSLTGDIRDRARVEQTVSAMAPEVIIHLAGKRAASAGLKRPLDSFDTNAAGTLNLLHAARSSPGLRAIIVVTPDPSCEPADAALLTVDGRAIGEAREAFEPTAASLACVEIIAETFRQCYLQPADGIGLATLRLPEIVGGGDFGADRLVPDVLRSLAVGQVPCIAEPARVRPLLHVLDALACCLALASALLQRPRIFARPWSLAREAPAPWTTGAIAGHIAARLGAQPQPRLATSGPPPRHRTPLALRLDDLGLDDLGLGLAPGLLSVAPDALPLLLEGSSAATALGWSPRLDVATALDWALDGYRRLEATADGGFIADQWHRFEALALSAARVAISTDHSPTLAEKANHVALLA